jgi:hypothetical protein
VNGLIISQSRILNGNSAMQMISYWKNSKEIYVDDGLTLIIGCYDHKNKDDGGYKALGVHWGDYPQSRGILSPCVIPETSRNAILSGLLHQAVSNNNEAQVAGIIEAIKFFNP